MDIKSLINNKNFVRGSVLVVLVGALTAGGFIYLKKTGRVFIEDSMVEAPVISLTPDNPGKLNELLVSEGDYVKKGDSIAVVGSNTVRTSTGGKIISVNRQLGANVSIQTPVAQMIDINNMRINGTIDENKGLNRVKVGQPASFTVDALPGKIFWGYVDGISESAKQTQISFSISSSRPVQQFSVYVKFNANGYPEIKNGMSAKMTVYTK